MGYRERPEVSRTYQAAYLAGIEHLISRREREMEKKRDAYVEEIFREPERCRKELRKMLGYPLGDRLMKGQARPGVVGKELLARENGYALYRMGVEVLPGITLTGLLFWKEGKRRPLVVAQHGGLGTPEVASGFYGDTGNYNHMVERLFPYDVHVLAPQLLLWDSASQGNAFDRQEIDARLKRVGSSIAAVEIYGITRLLDYFQEEDYVSDFGMLGLSYGGFYTLYTAAVDTRITAAVSCGYFNDRARYAWCDWTWFGAAGQFQDAEAACLIYPRHICIEVGIEDEVFDVEGARKEEERMERICAGRDMNWFSMVYFQGSHEFCREDGPIQRMVEMLRR